MKVVDANVLLYAVNEDAPHHGASHAWLDGTLGGTETVGFTWIVLLAFVRLSTRPGLFSRPLTLDDTVKVIETWLAQPAAVVLDPTPRHLSLLHGLLAPFGTAANLTNDAHLAAIAIEHRGTVVSFDNDFARFPGVRWQLPIAP